MDKEEILIEKLGEKILLEKKIVREINSFFSYLRNSRTSEERVMTSSQLRSLNGFLRKTGMEVIKYAEGISSVKPLKEESKTEIKSEFDDEDKSSSPFKSQEEFPTHTSRYSPAQSPLYPTGIEYADQSSKKDPGQIEKEGRLKREGKDGLTPIEKLTIKRIKKGEKKKETIRERKPSAYAKISSKFFYDLSISFINKGMFEKLRRDLVRGNIGFIAPTYLSMWFLSIVFSLIIAVIALIFFLFFSLTASPPFIVLTEAGITERLLKGIWMILLFPIITFVFGYFYPFLEKSTLEKKIDHELPFVAIHMSAVSSSMINPAKMFDIIISTGEYPHLKKEFIKLQNEINVHGYDLVTALKHRSLNSPSKKLSELFNGLATTITSGGDLNVFFEKRAQTLLFEYRLDVEKQGKTAETFMDIYISVVIAFPMVLMLILMMMRISGLGISLSPNMITFVMITIVSVVNAIFLMFLHLREQRSR